MKCKISVDEKWPIYAIDKIDTSGIHKQYEIEISDEFYSSYISIVTKYNLLQQQLGLIYDNTVPREQYGYNFSKGSNVEQDSFNKISKPS